jgi:hypothetical protein
VQVVFAFLIRVFDYLTDVVSSGEGLVAPLRRIECTLVPKGTNSTSASSAKLDDLNVLYRQVRWSITSIGLEKTKVSSKNLQV